MKKILKQIVGILMLFAVFIGLVMIAAVGIGIIDALIVWLIAMGIAGVMVVGMYLAAGD